MFKIRPSSFLTRLSLRALRQAQGKPRAKSRLAGPRLYPRNDMQHRLIIFFLIISPLLYILFVGYPIKKAVSLPGQSSRCFKVGELKEFTECYREGRRLSGNPFMKDASSKITSFLPSGGLLFFLFLSIHVFLLFALFL